MEEGWRASKTSSSKSSAPTGANSCSKALGERQVEGEESVEQGKEQEQGLPIPDEMLLLKEKERGE